VRVWNFFGRFEGFIVPRFLEGFLDAKMFHRKNNQTTEVPVGAGGTANYPAVGTPGVATQGVAPGYGDQAGRDVNMKAGYGYDQNGNVLPQQSNAPAYGGGGYVQQTPVSYGPNGQPLKKKSNKPANWCAAAFIACWACTWPCHGPCCCGL